MASPGIHGDAIPQESGDVAVTLEQRLQAWKHIVGNLQEYVEQHENLHKAMAKEFEKVGKTIGEPIKEAEMFTREAGGVQALFENLRTNNMALTVSHLDTAKAIKTGVTPQLERLHAEIKSKAKELTSGATKGTKAVAKAREATKKHIDQLATAAGQFDSAGANKLPEPIGDPYIVKRGVLHKLHKQVLEENGNKQDLLAVQSGFQAFEAQIIKTIQHSMNDFYLAVSSQNEKTKALYADVIGATNRLPVDFEWNGFLERFGHILIDPNKPDRDVASITFPNQEHTSTKPVVEGTLQKKGKIFGRYNSAYYVVTASNYLHEFENNDNFTKIPEPEMSLYLPECKISALSSEPDAKFTVSGKDANKNPKLTREHDFAFKAATHAEAQAWWDAISVACGTKTGAAPSSPLPTRENTLNTPPLSPATASPPAYEKVAGGLAVKTDAKITPGSPVASPTTATPSRSTPVSPK